MSAPYKGDVVLNACPAHFGLDLSKGDVGVSTASVMLLFFKFFLSLEGFVNSSYFAERVDNFWRIQRGEGTGKRDQRWWGTTGGQGFPTNYGIFLSEEKK